MGHKSKLFYRPPAYSPAPIQRETYFFFENWKNKRVQNVKVDLKGTTTVSPSRQNTLDLHSLSTQRIQHKTQASSGVSCSLRAYGVGER